MSITETEERLTKLETTVELELKSIHLSLKEIKSMIAPVAEMKAELNFVKGTVIFFLCPLVVGLLIWAISKHF